MVYKTKTGQPWPLISQEPFSDVMLVSNSEIGDRNFSNIFISPVTISFMEVKRFKNISFYKHDWCQKEGLV